MTTNSTASRTIRFIRVAAIVTLLSVILVSTVAQTYPAVLVRQDAAPTVYGDDAFKGAVDHALDILNAGYPADYANVTFWLSSIRPTDTYTRVDSYGTCYVNGNDSTGNPYWLASVLIHEAQHVADDGVYFADHPYSDEASEQRALTSQGDFLATINGWTPVQTTSWIDGWLAQQYWVTIPQKYSA